VHTMHPTLLVGPADWDAEALPRAEFDARIAAFWRAREDDYAGVVVHGSPRHHAELAYLTNFTPKLQHALALIPAAGTPQLLVGGGVNMIPAAKPLTWIEDMAGLRGAGKTVLAWARSLAAGPIAVIGFEHIELELHQDVVGVLVGADFGVPDVTHILRLDMRRKSARELALIRQSCAMLDDAVAAMRSAKSAGKGATDVILAAERAAYERGAQDVRTLFSPDGGRTLRPFEVTVAAPADPFQAYVAVRHRGYWAEGFVMLTDPPNPAREKARAALQQALTLMRSGARRSELDDAVRRALAPDQVHPVVTRAAASIGLSLDDEGVAGDMLLAGEVISLRSGVSGPGGAAICSAMVVVERGGHAVLWSADPLT
jgi:Xaa-Pro aminopeptidase